MRLFDDNKSVHDVLQFDQAQLQHIQLIVKEKYVVKFYVRRRPVSRRASVQLPPGNVSSLYHSTLRTLWYCSLEFYAFNVVCSRPKPEIRCLVGLSACQPQGSKQGGTLAINPRGFRSRWLQNQREVGLLTRAKTRPSSSPDLPPVHWHRNWSLWPNGARGCRQAERMPRPSAPGLAGGET